MKGEDISELREELQSVRGETRVKTKEESIRNRFLQAACNEVFTDHDWLFNRRAINASTLVPETVDVLGVPTATGRFEAPSDFSMFNDFYVGTKNKVTVSQTKESIIIDQEAEKTLITFAQSPQHTFVYHIQAPDLIADNAIKVYFPQHILLAERAYVRLKTAYFPDEDSDKELARSRRALRELYKKAAPKQNFTTSRWG
ncbi:MAG: hypothetical protein ACOH18_05600 [Candidatus Saccharimonadaceae bacterium]